MATGYIQAAFESTPGNETNTPTLSTKKLYPPFTSADFQDNPDPLTRDDENRNVDEPLAVLEEAHAPTWSLTSRAYPDTLGFLLKALLGAPVTTAGDGVITDPDSTAIPADAYRHVWTAPFGPTGATPMTMQLQAAYANLTAPTYLKAKGCAVDSFSLTNPDRGGSMVSVSGPALYLTRQSNPSLTPTYEATTIAPFTRRQLALAWLSGSAAAEDFTLNAANPVEATPTVGGGSYWPDLMEKGEGLLTWSGDIPKRQLDPDDWDALIHATAFAATATWESETIIASSYPYKLFVEMPNSQYVSGGPSDLTNARRIGASFGFRPTYAGSASVTITLVNATASYA